MTASKTFLLGVGCPKGGTTWLYDYLTRHPHVNFGAEKEYHVFDALYIDECRVYLQKKPTLKSRAKRALTKQRLTYKKHLHRFQSDPETYFDYFDQLLKNRDTTLTGDMTPSYCGLPTEALRLIQKGCRERGMAIKVIFLMRDPVERIWSEIRMHRRDASHGYRRDQAELDVSESENVRRLFRTGAMQFRTRYETTITNLDAVFEPGQVHYDFYETFLDKKSLKRLMDFLRLDFHEPNLSQKVNVSVKANSLAPTVIEEIREFYAPTYDFVQAYFPNIDLKAIWRYA